MSLELSEAVHLPCRPKITWQTRDDSTTLGTRGSVDIFGFSSVAPDCPLVKQYLHLHPTRGETAPTPSGRLRSARLCGQQCDWQTGRGAPQPVSSVPPPRGTLPRELAGASSAHTPGLQEAKPVPDTGLARAPAPPQSPRVPLWLRRRAQGGGCVGGACGQVSVPCVPVLFRPGGYF